VPTTATVPYRICLNRCCSAQRTSLRLGQPVVPNGIPLSKIHHAGFDAHLIGIDPDYRLHVAERLLEQQDGPMLEALKRVHGETIPLPRPKDYPDRDRLAVVFERFKAAACPRNAFWRESGSVARSH
jgi:putative restriction endonuclease